MRKHLQQRAKHDARSLFNLEGILLKEREEVERAKNQGSRKNEDFAGRGDATERVRRGACAAASDTKTASTRGYSSAGRAPALQAGGRRFDSDYLHQTKPPSKLAAQTGEAFVTRRGDVTE